MCVYDESGVTPTLLFKGTAPHGGLCGTKPCWKQTGSPLAPKGFKYSDSLLTPDGTSVIDMKAGTLGRAKVLYKGKGVNLNLSSFITLPLPLRAQVQGTNGSCFQAAFHATGLQKNALGQFKAKAD